MSAIFCFNRRILIPEWDCCASTLMHIFTLLSSYHSMQGQLYNDVPVQCISHPQLTTCCLSFSLSLSLLSLLSLSLSLIALRYRSAYWKPATFCLSLLLSFLLPRSHTHTHTHTHTHIHTHNTRPGCVFLPRRQGESQSGTLKKRNSPECSVFNFQQATSHTYTHWTHINLFHIHRF